MIRYDCEPITRIVLPVVLVVFVLTVDVVHQHSCRSGTHFISWLDNNKPIMIATIILSLTLGVSFIIQTINRWRCKAVTCTRTDDHDETANKDERPTLVVPTRRPTIHNMFTDDDKCA